MMHISKHIQNAMIGATAVLVAGARVFPGPGQSGPVPGDTAQAVRSHQVPTDSSYDASSTPAPTPSLQTALNAFAGLVRPLSQPRALEDAFRSYLSYKSAHPADVKKPYLYFVDYGLPSTTARGYVFDMDALKIVDGPFTVAHGRGSSTNKYGIPTRFSNASGSAATSLGLYLAKDTYGFHGHSGGAAYSSVGLKLIGVSSGFNDNAMARGVVAHGAPYVTPTKAGRSKGCPAMETARAERLLPKLANGGMVFLFAPDANWLANDHWLTDAHAE